MLSALDATTEGPYWSRWRVVPSPGPTSPVRVGRRSGWVSDDGHVGGDLEFAAWRLGDRLSRQRDGEVELADGCRCLDVQRVMDWRANGHAALGGEAAGETDISAPWLCITSATVRVVRAALHQ
jgi:hypothetical protein